MNAKIKTDISSWVFIYETTKTIQVNWRKLSRAEQIWVLKILVRVSMKSRSSRVFICRGVLGVGMVLKEHTMNAINTGKMCSWSESAQFFTDSKWELRKLGLRITSWEWESRGDLIDWIMKSFVRIYSLLWANILVGYALFVMQNYLTDVWKLSVTHAAGIVNIWNGVSIILPVFFLFFVETSLGNFVMLVVSSISYSVVSWVTLMNNLKIQTECDTAST